MKIHHSRNLYTLRFDVQTVSNLWRSLRRVSSSWPLTAALSNIDFNHHGSAVLIAIPNFEEKKNTLKGRHLHTPCQCDYPRFGVGVGAFVFLAQVWFNGWCRTHNIWTLSLSPTAVNIFVSLKEGLHNKPKLSMLCSLSQNFHSIFLINKQDFFFFNFINSHATRTYLALTSY